MQRGLPAIAEHLVNYISAKLGGKVFIFTVLHAMQTRCSDENSVCLSVRPSVCQTLGL